MSMKHTILYHEEPATSKGPVGFHLYTDVFDDADGPLYLELDGTAFLARPQSVTVIIPREWAERLGLGVERWREMTDALKAAGHPLSDDNGHLALRALQGLIAERDELRLLLNNRKETSNDPQL